MVKQTQPQEEQTPAVNLIIIGKVHKPLLGKLVLALICASLVLPACKSHKLCEAYSYSTPKKEIKAGVVTSTNQSSKVHNNPL
jgi:hypothetical protein